MTAQIKPVTDAVAALMVSMGNKEIAAPNGTNALMFNWTRNMGCYCWSHGHHPIRAKRTSSTCTQKKEGHVDNVIMNDQKGSNNFWQATNNIKHSQQNHVRFKEKSTPSN
jgi:hypothetical protein